MRVLIIGIISLVCVLGLSEGRKACYHAKICIHNGKERCGEDKEGKFRRFLDSCDILEYNCLKGTAFVKTKMENCNNLPPIEKEKKDDKLKDGENEQKEENKSEEEKKDERKKI